MTTTTDLGTARQRLVAALDASRAADARAARRALAGAERGLREAGRDAAADRLARIVDVTTAEARTTVRAVLTVLDAAANPTVSRAAFVPASEVSGDE